MTGKSLEERLQIVHHVFLVIGENTRVHSEEAPKADTYRLVRAILKNDLWSTSPNCSLIQVLKHSPVWEEVKLFLHNSSSLCARKGCNCDSYYHNGPGGCCTRTRRHNKVAPYIQVLCECNGFIQREF